MHVLLNIMHVLLIIMHVLLSIMHILLGIMHILLSIMHIFFFFFFFFKYLFGIMHVSRRSSQLIICTPFVAENGDADVGSDEGNECGSTATSHYHQKAVATTPLHPTENPVAIDSSTTVIFALSRFAFLHRSPLLSLDHQFNDRWMINEVLSADVSHKVEPVNGGSATNL